MKNSVVDAADALLYASKAYGAEQSDHPNMKKLIRMAIPLIVLLLACPVKAEPAVVTQLDQVPALKLGKQAWSNSHTQIHRITTATALKRLGGLKQLPIDFDTQDLVVVRGALGCAHGKVEYTTEKSVVSFSVGITEQCRHLNAVLCFFPYSNAFVIGKDTRIAPSVPIDFVRGGREQGNLAEKLAKTDATHLNLFDCGITDEDLKKLREFKNLRHLYLGKNKITDKGLANLSHLTTLLELYLDGNAGITDAGIDDLSPMMTSRIEILGIRNTQLSHEGLKKLQGLSKQQAPQINHSLVTPQLYK